MTEREFLERLSALENTLKELSKVLDKVDKIIQMANKRIKEGNVC